MTKQEELKYEMELEMKQEAHEGQLLRIDYDYAEEQLVGNQEDMDTLLELAEKLAQHMNDYGWIDYSKEDVLEYAKGL